jgi:signal peptidase I
MKIPKQRLPKSIARQYAESIGIALILAVVMRSSFVEAYVIPSGSMEPTILVGDHIFVNKVAYGLRIPRTIAGLPVPGLSSGKYLVHLGAIHHGDIVVFESPRERGLDLIKRVIGLPGDKVQVINGAVWRNGERLADGQLSYA